MQGLQKVQNNTMRTLMKKKLSDIISISELLESCGWHSVNRLTIQNILMDAWKMITFDLSHDIVSDITKDYSRNTRAAEKGDFCPDPFIASKVVKTSARLLNNNLFNEIKHCTQANHA